MSPAPTDDPTEASLRPPEPARETSPLRWAGLLVALLALALAAWHGWGWLHEYVAQRHAVAEGRAPATPSADGAEGAASAPPAAAAPSVAVARGDSGEPMAPAVTGEAIRRCIQPDGQLTFTNQACPAGSSAEPTPAAAAPELRQAVRFDAGEDPSLHEASCHYLAAEIARLDYEFRQPLPPPVIDLISTRLSTLRNQSEQGRCAPLPKPATVAAPSERATRKVLTENPGAAPKPRR
ncbi:MAG: hypothetical protein JSR16_01975 [Proteobacteria bacterium]|nr:hypothetical protein [Pseudomonadota bacterium]